MQRSKNPLLTYVHKIFIYKNQIILVSIFAIIFASGLTGYSIYRRMYESKAHRAYLDALKVFNASIKKDAKQGTEKLFASYQEKWIAVAHAFDKAYTAFPYSNLSPYFLAYKADAQNKIGQNSQALQTLQASVPSMSAHGLKDIYEIKIALLQLESSSVQVQQEGRVFLEQKVNDQACLGHDIVLYQLGNYHWTHKEFKQAKNYWSILKLLYGSGTSHPSPWAEQVNDKLKLLGS